MIQTTTARETRIRYRASGSSAYTTLTQGIDSGSIDIDDLLCESVADFGLLCSSKFECRLYQDINLTGKEILIDTLIDGTYVPLFFGVVDSAKLDNSQTYRQIVAYDFAYSMKEQDVATEWHGIFTTSRTIKQAITAFCTACGITADFSKVPTTYNTHLGRTLRESVDLTNGERITFGQMIGYLCEISALYCHFSASDNKKLVFYPFSHSNVQSVSGKYETGNSDFEDYLTDAITGVCIYQDGVTRATAGTDANMLFISDNPLMWDYTDTEATQIATDIKNLVAGVQFRPASIEMIVSAPDLALGDIVTAGTDYGNTFVAHKRLYGVQGFSQNLSCEGEKTLRIPNRYNPELRRLSGRIGEAEATLEILDDKIESKVSQTDYDSDMAGVDTRLNSAEGNISTLDGRLDTAEGDIGTLETGVSGLTSRVTTAESTISQQATQIASKVSQTEYNTNKTATDNRIASAESRIGSAESDIEDATESINTLDGRLDTAEGSISTLGTNVNGLSSRMTTAESNITQNATAISQRVTTSTYNTNKTATDNRIASAEGRLTTAEADISSAETSIGTIGTRLTSAESEIEQNAHDITLKVSQTDYTGQTIAAKINQSASTVQIDAGHINLNGVVTANNNFKINTDGSMETIRGKIGGFDISADRLYKDASISGSTYRVSMYAPNNAQLDNGAFSLVKTTGNVTEYPYVLHYDGTMESYKAKIGGGTIGGWTIENGMLVRQVNAFVPFSYTEIERVQRLLAGYDDPPLSAQEKAWYDLDCDGTVDGVDLLRMNKVRSGLESIETYHSQYGYVIPLFQLTLTANPEDANAVVRVSGTAYGRSFESKLGAFGVKGDTFLGQSAELTTITSESIQSDEAKIGEFSIKSGNIYKETTVNDIGYETNVASPSNASLSSGAFFILKNDHGTKTYPFVVHLDGSVNATGITSASGTIGGCTINASGYSKDVTVGSATETVKVFTPNSAQESNGVFSLTKVQGGATTYPFVVKYDGSVTATGISVNGQNPETKHAITSSDSRVIIENGYYVRFGKMVTVTMMVHASANTSTQITFCTLPKPVGALGLHATSYTNGQPANLGYYYMNASGQLRNTGTVYSAEKHLLSFSYVAD